VRRDGYITLHRTMVHSFPTNSDNSRTKGLPGSIEAVAVHDQNGINSAEDSWRAMQKR
jgi:hypothetical protein